MRKKLLFTFMIIFTFIVMIGCDGELSTLLTTSDITTEEVTTDNITTVEPTTEVETITTEDITTVEITTVVTTTEEVTTEVPTTIEPTTDEPTTVVPTTEIPTTEMPTTTETPTTTEEITTENPIDELFFSEYVEGSGVNKALEIFNGTGSDVSLSSYSIKLYYNGSTSAGTTIPLSGTIANNDVYVIANSGAEPTLTSLADLLNGSLNFNGNDAVGLYKNDVLVDLIGNIGSSTDFAINTTLVRIDSVFSPSVYYQASEWDSYAQDTFEYLGFHSDVQPDDTTLLNQDVAQLPEFITIVSTNSYEFGSGDNGSTYTITNVTGEASAYVTYLDDYIESTLTEDLELVGTIEIEVNLSGVGSETVYIGLIIKLDYNNLDTSTHPEYYTTISEGLTGTALEEALRTLISDYTYYSYDDARYILDETDADPDNPGNVLLVYTGYSVDSTWDAGATWNREHVWPQSLLDYDTVMSSDLHNLKPANPTENSSRGNKYFDNVASSLAYEPRDEVKGDIARILFYMAVRYDMDLVNTTPGIYEMGLLDVLLSWHIQDPVDDFELNRNNVIYSYQENRNPFIDHPEYVALIWG